MIELSTVEGELHKNIMILNPSGLDSIQEFTTTGSVAVFLKVAIIRLGIFQNLSRRVLTVVHLLCSLKQAIKSLDHRT